MRIVIAVLIGLVSAIVGTWFAFFNPGIGVVMSVSIIGAAIIYLLSKGKRPLILETVLCQKNNTLYSKYTAAPVTLRAN